MLDNPQEKLAELTELNEILGPSGLTDAVSIAVRSNLEGFTAVQVRDMLEAMKFDLSKYSNALAAIHTTLKRLDIAGKVKAIPRQSGETIYQWNESAGPRLQSQGTGKKRGFIRQGIYGASRSIARTPDELLDAQVSPNSTKGVLSTLVQRKDKSR